MELLFILAIIFFAADVIEDALNRGVNWTALGLCLFAIAIYLA